MDTRKRNVLIGVGAAILVVVVILVVLMVSGGSSQDEAASKTDSAVAAASDSSSKDVGVMHASCDGTADNEVDASEVYGDSPDAATGEPSAGTSTSGGDTPSVIIPLRRVRAILPTATRQVAPTPASKLSPTAPSGRVTTKSPILLAPTARQRNSQSRFQDDSRNLLF